MRARYPDCEGIVVRDGVGIGYERHGQGRPAILLLIKQFADRVRQ
jgi:hypothetical protein